VAVVLVATHIWRVHLLLLQLPTYLEEDVSVAIHDVLTLILQHTWIDVHGIDSLILVWLVCVLLSNV